MRFARLCTWAACAAAALLPAAGLRAEDRRAREENDRAEKVVKEFLDDKKANVAPIAITDEAVKKAFPGHAVFAVIFRQYPVAILAPEPFKAQNLLIVPKEGKMVHLTNTKGLETFFKDQLKAVK